MSAVRDIELLLDSYDECFDAWEAGGVDGLVVGPMVFDDTKCLANSKMATIGGPPSAAFDPDPSVYAGFGVEPPPAPTGGHHLRAQLDAMLTAAKDRGWEVWIMQGTVGAGPGRDVHWVDDHSLRVASARVVDTLQHFPMADGNVFDGPEWRFEISPVESLGAQRDMRLLFDDLPPSLAPVCDKLGYDYDAFCAAKDRFLHLLHNLEPRRVRTHAGGGLIGAFELFGADPDLMAWFHFRTEALTEAYRSMHTQIRDAANRPVQLGLGPRTPALAPLAGYDLAGLAEFTDLLMPKLYFWHRGYDGLIGTIWRYVEVLRGWNAALEVTDALAVVQALLGLTLPDVAEVIDFDDALTPEFFRTVATSEAQRALAAANGTLVVPWIDAGRSPHDGDPMSSSQLRMLLTAAATAGVERVAYCHHEKLSASEWAVISHTCCEGWDPSAGAYRPPDLNRL